MAKLNYLGSVVLFHPPSAATPIPYYKVGPGKELAALDKLLDDDKLFQRVKDDLARRYPNSLTRGRNSTPVEVILRMLVVRRLYDWSYEQTEHFVSDSLVLRQFCRLYLEPAPDDSTLIRWAALIGPQTLEQLNEHVVRMAYQLRVTRGRKLRTDPTVVETNIAYPRDSGLLRDGVRVVSRVIARAKGLVGASVQNAPAVFRNRTSSAKRLARQIADEARHRGQEAEVGRRATYRRLLKIAEATLKQAETVQALVAEQPAAVAQKLQESLEQFVPLVKQVMAQTHRRVLEGEAVPATEKLVSIFEPHTQIIRRGKVNKPTEFGRKICLDEVDGGIINRYRVLEGNPSDDRGAPASLANHQRVFAHPPNLFAGDRGIHSAENEVTAYQVGVKKVVLPQPGYKTKERQSHERQSWFRQGMRFRAGIEGRISVLKRRGNLGRCRDKGENGFGRWIGWGVVIANLQTIARTQAARS